MATIKVSYIATVIKKTVVFKSITFRLEHFCSLSTTGLHCSDRIAFLNHFAVDLKKGVQKVDVKCVYLKKGTIRTLEYPKLA